MRITVDASGIADLRARLMDAASMLPQLLEETVKEAGDDVVSSLGDDAPHGKGDGPPVGSDAPGPLAESFSASVESTDTSATVTVSTSQPEKLKLVVEGTGIYGPRGTPIRPVKAKALYWDGADHPVRQVRGMRANDFVSPVLDDAKDEQGMLEDVVTELSNILQGE